MTARADIMQALREMATGGQVLATLQAIADRAGVSKRTVIRVLRVIERRGEIQRTGREREVGWIRLVTPDAKTASCHHRITTDDPADLTPGAEYTPINDVAAVAADRVRYYRATGRAVPAGLLALTGET